MKSRIKMMVMGIVVAGFALTYISALFAQEENIALAQNETVTTYAPLKSKPIEQKVVAEERRDLKPKEDPEVVTLETVSGDVSAINKQGIALVYNRDYDAGKEYEIYLPIDKSTQLKHIKSFNEIKEGDLISIDYEKSNKKPSRAAVVSFIQHAATAGLVSKEEPQAQVLQEEVSVQEVVE